MKSSVNGLTKFIELYTNASDKKISAELFDLFFTAEEKKDISLRYAIIQELLAEKKAQRKISEDLGVSIAKITRGSNELKRMSPKLINYLREAL